MNSPLPELAIPARTQEGTLLPSRLTSSLVLMLTSDVALGMTLAFSAQFASPGAIWYTILFCATGSTLTSAISVLAGGRYAFAIIQAGFVYWYLIPVAFAAWREEVFLESDGTRFTNAEQIAWAAVCVFASKVVATLAYAAIAHRQHSAPKASKPVIPRPWFLFLQIILGIVPFFVVSNPLQQIMSGRSGALNMRTQTVDTSTMFLELFFFLASAALISSYFLLITHGPKRVFYGSFFIVAVGTLTVFGGTRTLLLLYVMPALTLYVLVKGSRRAAGVILASAICLYFVANLLVAHRDEGFGSSANVSDRNFVDNDQFSEFVFSRAVIPADRDFSYESPILYAFTGLVPRVLWPNKPGPVNSEFVMRLRMGALSGALTGNLTPGIIGQYWDTSGWLGVATSGLWLGLAAGLLDCKLRSHAMHVKFCAVVVAWSLFISFRGVFTGNMVPAGLVWLTFKLSERSHYFGAIRLPNVIRLHRTNHST